MLVGVVHVFHVALVELSPIRITPKVFWVFFFNFTNVVRVLYHPV